MELKSYLSKLNGNAIQIVFSKSDIDYRHNYILHAMLFILTFITTTLVGSTGGNNIIEYFLNGLPYSISLMLILTSHEMGHYFAAKSYGVIATLPYFIPFPSIIGTMGAVIKIKTPIPDKKSLFYIGCMGPLAGFIISLIVSIIGLNQSIIIQIPDNAADIIIFGDSILFYILTKAILGNIPAGFDVQLSPMAWAGWIGFLVTSLNLMPVGQLDGSHILYALFGKKQLYFGWLFFIGLLILSFFWHGWILWIFIILTFVMIGHPYIPTTRKLNKLEYIIGIICIIIFIITFIPIPVKI